MLMIGDQVEHEIMVYRDIKSRLMGRDYEDAALQRTFRKMRYHLDRMILQLENLDEQQGQKDPDF